MQAPIFHVNGDDPEACVRVARLAFEYRQTFHKDVVIDMVCYRRHGHNEGDDPSYTQPLMYKAIAERRSVRKLYVETLVKRGDITVDEAEQALADFQGKLQVALDETRAAGDRRRSRPPSRRSRVGVLPHIADRRRPADARPDLRTSSPTTRRASPSHPKLAKQFEAPHASCTTTSGEVDWATAEALAIGSLVLEGHRCASPARTPAAARSASATPRSSTTRPASRGSRSPTSTGAEASFWVYDSLLSEYAALGFEYGYAHANPDALVLWEAQFGDFINGAQIIIDQYLVAAEDKWDQHNGLVLLLPHGYEGQGPEHSSARIERFLDRSPPRTTSRSATPRRRRSTSTCCAARCTASVTRRSCVFTPKQGLRMKQTRSPIDELTTGSFQEVLDDPFVTDPAAVRRIVFCRGKVAWDAIAERDRRGAPVAVVRVEQLYPLPTDQLLTLARAATRTPSELRLAAGGAREHGRLELRRAPHVAGQGAGLRPAPRRPGRVGQPGHRLEDDPRPGARRPHGRGLRRPVTRPDRVCVTDTGEDRRSR